MGKAFNQNSPIEASAGSWLSLDIALAFYPGMPGKQASGLGFETPQMGEIPDEPAKSNKKIHLGPLIVGKNTNGSN